jgi:hypothetical protein
MVEIATGDWANFLFAEVGASAALTGLVAVAISINLSRFLPIRICLGALPRRCSCSAAFSC